jgi:hypothetical protein
MAQRAGDAGALPGRKAIDRQLQGRRLDRAFCAMFGSGLFLIVSRLSGNSMAKYFYVFLKKIGDIIAVLRPIWPINKPPEGFQTTLYDAMKNSTGTWITTKNMTTIEASDVSFTLLQQEFQLL